MGYQRPARGISASAGGWWLGWPPAALASSVLVPVVLAGAANTKVPSKKKTRACKNMIEERRPALGCGSQAWCFIREPEPLCMRCNCCNCCIAQFLHAHHHGFTYTFFSTRLSTPTLELIKISLVIRTALPAPRFNGLLIVRLDTSQGAHTLFTNNIGPFAVFQPTIPHAMQKKRGSTPLRP
jgi:hypothetical protein